MTDAIDTQITVLLESALAAKIGNEFADCIDTDSVTWYGGYSRCDMLTATIWDIGFTDRSVVRVYKVDLRQVDQDALVELMFPR